jgi:protein-tyrosine phosphatase
LDVEQMIKIAMVCMGNICRSPIAEHVMRAKAADAGLEVLVESAGTGGWHIGDAADPRTVTVLEDHGYTSSHQAQQFGPDWFDRFDYILVMDDENLKNVLSQTRDPESIAKVRMLMEFDSTAQAGSIVPDPYYGVAADYLHVLDLVERACDGLVAHLKAQ